MRRIKSFSPLADKSLSNITGEWIDKYANWREGLEAGNSLASQNGELRTLRGLFRLAQQWDAVDKGPAIHELSGAMGRDRVISFQEEARYLKEASPTLRDIATLGVDTGLRPNSELFPFEWANVCVEPSANGPHGYVRVVSGKTASATRNLPLTPGTRTILEMRRNKPGSGRYVFPGPGRSSQVTTVQHAQERTIRRWNEKTRRQGLAKTVIEPFVGGTASERGAQNPVWTSSCWLGSWATVPPTLPNATASMSHSRMLPRPSDASWIIRRTRPWNHFP